MSRTPVALLSGLAAVTVALSACSGPADDEGVTGGASQVLAGKTFTVGSKDFTESVLLAQITMQVLGANGAEVVDRTNIKGSATTREALLAGKIDMYWEYTGTGWVTYLMNTTPIPDAQRQFDAVAMNDLALNKIVWVGRTPLNNAYAIAVRSTTATALGLSKLSDLAALAATDPAKVTFCVESEFSTRDDGLPGMLTAYGITVPADNFKILETGVIYSATAKGTTCTFGEVFTTDGRITPLGLTVLADDRSFFPIHNAALTMRAETATAEPRIAGIMAPIAEKLTDEAMRRLNAEVDDKGLEPVEVARTWLTTEGLLT